MNQKRFDALTKLWTSSPSRRHLLRGLAGTALGLGVARLPDFVAAKNPRQRKKKPKKGLCKQDGSPCRKPGKRCKREYCRNVPFTIEARWTETADHEAYLFVPPQDATTGPSPHIFSFCNPDNSRCEDQYPFACVDDDVYTTGTEVTTIHKLLPGPYEYWVELDSRPTNPDGEVTVTPKDKDGRLVRRWTRRADPAVSRLGWHVFDIDGRTSRVTAIDAVLTEAPLYLPNGAHDPYTQVCPYNA